MYYDKTMSNQAKDTPKIKINSKQYEQMRAKAPSFAQSMVTITQIMGTKPANKIITGTRQFTDSQGRTFQEMDEQKSKKVVAE